MKGIITDIVKREMRKMSMKKTNKKINEKLQRLTGRQKELIEQREAGQKESKEVKKHNRLKSYRKVLKNPLTSAWKGSSTLKTSWRQ